MNELQIDLQLPREKVEVCQKALALETESESLHRSEIKLEEFEHRKPKACENEHQRVDGLRISVNAKDLSAMRAAVNTYLRWVIMCCNLIDQ